MMAVKISELETENCLRELLEVEKYILNKKTGLAKLGPGIKASKNKEDWYIEVVGFEESGIDRVEDFYIVFFHAISRLNNKDCDHVIIAMPEQSRKFLPIRAKIYKVAWKRIAKAFPELEIWLVDIENKKYQKTSWSYWLKPKK